MHPLLDQSKITPEFVNSLTLAEQKELLRQINVPDLGEFCQATFDQPLHEWQRDYLIPILQRCLTETGLRIMLHAPPQVGKSIIASQRLPAWLMGIDPTHRVGLLTFNETHSRHFGTTILKIMGSDVYRDMFPDVKLEAAKPSCGSFSTVQRAQKMDGQASFVALGMGSPITGKGMSTLLWDDPYKSFDDAKSDAVNEATWHTAIMDVLPRLKEYTNLIVIFHRYHSDDLAARLLALGKFEYLNRFPAVADGGNDDPTGRKPNTILTPLLTPEMIEDAKRRDMYTYLSLYQGTPPGTEGSFFKVKKLNQIEEAPKEPMRMCRAWDLAATEGAGDWTVGVKIGITQDNKIYILDVVRDRWGTDLRNDVIRSTAERDGRACQIRLPIDPGAAGKDAALYLARQLAGYNVITEPVSGAKFLRASGFSSQVNAGNVNIIKADWTPHYIRELSNFLPNNKAGTDDQVDASSDAFNQLVLKVDAVVDCNMSFRFADFFV